MSNIRKLHNYDKRADRLSIYVDGKERWFNKDDAFDARSKVPGHFGVKIEGRNFFFPTNANLANGAANPYWSIVDSKISRTIPPLTFPRIRIDAELWRSAIQEMEAKPWNWRVKAQTILQDVILDAHVKGCWLKRKRMTLKKKPAFFDDEGNQIESPDLTFINSHWWYQLIDFMLDAQGYGYQLIELGTLTDGIFKDITVVPRQNISPDREIVAAVVYNVNGVPFNFGPNQFSFTRAGKQFQTQSTAANGEKYYDWHIWVKTPNEFGAHTSTCGYGLFYWCALYAVLIRNNLQYNSDFIEKFLSPIVQLKTAKTDPKERQEKFKELEEMGNSLTILTDPGDELELHVNNNAKSSNDAHGLYEDRLQKAISFLLLGHRDAVHSTPGKLGSSQGGKNEDGQENSPINKAMLEVEQEQDRWISAMIEECVLPKLRNLGFKIPEGIKYGYLNDEQDNLEKDQMNKHNLDFAEVIQTLAAAGWEVTPEYIEQETGIKVQQKVAPPKEENTPDENDEEEIEDVKNLYHTLKEKYGKHI